MNVHHTLICFFFLSLQDGNTEDTKPQNIFYGVAGRNFTVRCFISSPGRWKMFCKEDCKGENILIETAGDRVHSDRYSIGYGYEQTRRCYVLSVSITKLTQSDFGLYSCGLGGSLSSVSYRQFRLLVAEALLDGNHDPSQQKHFYKETGCSLTVGCSFKHSGRNKFFCREECGGDKILVQTVHARDQRDRYTIGYEERNSRAVLLVTITQLTTSDSGRYRCYLGGTSGNSFREYMVTVTDADVPSASIPTTTQSFSSSSGSSAPSFYYTGTNEQSERKASTDVLLFVGLTLLSVIILVSVAVLIFHWKRSSKPKDPPIESVYAAVTESTNANIREEDRQRESYLVEINPVYAYAKYSKPSGVGADHDHSLITSAISHHKAKDNSCEIIYSEVKFFKKTFGSPNSASWSNTNQVINSVPPVHVSSEPRADPVYSLA